MPDDYLEIGLMLDASPATAGALAATQSFRTILDVLSEARNQAAQLGEQTFRFRDAMRDIQALGGGGRVTEETMNQQLEFMRATGMLGTEAHEYREQFLGEAESYRGKMDPEQFRRLETLSAQYAVSLGGDVAPRAQLTGRLIGLGAAGRSAEDVLGEQAEVNRLLGLGAGRTDLLTQSYLNAAAGMVQEGGGGAVSGTRELAVLAMGASRLGAPSTVDTTLRQFQRGVQGFGTPEWQGFVRDELGVKEGTPVEQAMRPMFTWLDQQQAQGRDMNAALMERGLRDMETRRAIIGMRGQQEPMYAELEGRGGQPWTADVAQRQIAEFYADPTAGGARMARSGAEVQQIRQGMEDEEAMTSLINAQTKLRNARRIEGPALAENALRDILLKPTGLSGDAALIYQTAQEDWERQNKTQLIRDEPGPISRAVSWGLAGLPILGEMAYTGLGGQVKEGQSFFQTQQDIQDTIETYTGNRAVGFGQRIQIARGNQQFDELAGRTGMGPTGRQMTVDELRQYGTEHNWTPAEMTRNVAEFTRGMMEDMKKLKAESARPLGGAPPKPANGYRRP